MKNGFCPRELLGNLLTNFRVLNGGIAEGVIEIKENPFCSKIQARRKTCFIANQNLVKTIWKIWYYLGFEM